MDLISVANPKNGLAAQELFGYAPCQLEDHVTTPTADVIGAVQRADGNPMDLRRAVNQFVYRSVAAA